MKYEKKIYQILFILILCLLVICIGRKMDFQKTEEVKMYLQTCIFQHVSETYFTGYEYMTEKKERLPGNWFVENAFKLIPLGAYVCENISPDLDVEDADTFAFILKQQADDEHDPNENRKQKDEGGEEKKIPATIDKADVSIDKLSDYEYLTSTFYTIDGNTSVHKEELDARKLLAKNMKINQATKGPKILIYHTHSQEDFKDSKKGDSDTTIMGMGAYLGELLNKKYHIETLHHEGVYDLVNGKMDRSKAYQLAEKQIRKILKANPTIEVVIDLHRDGVGEGTHLVTNINGEPTAQIMFFNGMSRTKSKGDIAYLNNPYIEDNLALSLQMQITAARLYPGFTRRIYLKSYRYNLHLKPKSMLIEAGAQTNTVNEMKNAMKVLAKVLKECLVE